MYENLRLSHVQPPWKVQTSQGQGVLSYRHGDQGFTRTGRRLLPATYARWLMKIDNSEVSTCLLYYNPQAIDALLYQRELGGLKIDAVSWILLLC